MNKQKIGYSSDSFLGQIDSDSWMLLTNTWTEQTYKAGQFLISEEDRSNRDVFFVIEGRAKATIYTEKGREVSFVEIKSGDTFGEFSAIDNSPRSASVVAATDCIAARLSQEDFVEIVRSRPDISYTIMKNLIGHLRSLSRRVVDFNSKNADRRLHEALLNLGRKEQKNNEDVVIIRRPPTQTELASFIFASRESVAREMGKLKKMGLIEREKRALVIPSMTALEELAFKD